MDPKREVDEHVRDHEAHPDERVSADVFLAALRRKFQSPAPK
jgi:hypothetical protein